jgi:hypothetical protein
VSDYNEPGYTAKVSCEVCLSEIPPSEARSEEGEDYVRYFCGLDCFDVWESQAGPEGGAQSRR